MKKILLFTLMVAFILSVVTGCGGYKEQATSKEVKTEPVTLTISAAASLKDAAEELKVIYAKDHPDVNITYNFGASGTLQKQIEEGAPVDLFISAGQKQMDALEEKDIIVKESRKNLLGNNLVLVAKKASTVTSFEDLSKKEVDKIAIGTPESVPAGQYAKEALTCMKLWDKLQAKLVMAKDVRQVLTYVETGNAATGIIYNSDALMGKDIKIITNAPAESYKPILYPMAIIKNAKQQKAAEAFANYLAGEDASQIFEKYGFKAIKE